MWRFILQTELFWTQEPAESARNEGVCCNIKRVLWARAVWSNLPLECFHRRQGGMTDLLEITSAVQRPCHWLIKWIRSIVPLRGENYSRVTGGESQQFSVIQKVVAGVQWPKDLWICYTLNRIGVRVYLSAINVLGLHISAGSFAVNTLTDLFMNKTSTRPKAQQ